MDRFYKISKSLKQLYPFQLLILVFAPLLVGCFIDAELVEGRYVLINFIWLTLLGVPVVLLRSKLLYRLVVLLYLIIGFIEIGHWLILKGPISITSILVSTNTNFQEAVSFFDLKASISLLLFIPYLLLGIYAFWSPPTYTKSKTKLYLGVILLLASSIYIFENTLNARFIRKSTPQILKVSLSYFDQRKLYSELSQEVAPLDILVKDISGYEEQTFVLIIGESLNKNHMSLYGAKRITTPQLDKRKDIIVFEDVVSPYSNTISSVLTILSESNLENSINFKHSIDLFDVFSSAGYETYWISNQSPLGIWENMVTLFAKQADHLQFTNISSNSSKESALTSSYDEKVFLPFYEALHANAPKKLIIIHLMGSHSTYSKRYPADFQVFEGTNKKESLRAAYDNSVYYNDFIVDSLFNSLVIYSSINTSSVSSAIYLADHGENVYDENDQVGHDFANQLPQSHVEIPFIVWLSPNYKQLNKQKVASIKSNKHKPFVSDDLFHSILDLNEIQCAPYEEKRSIFNLAFDDTRKRVLEDGRDYDEQ